jgi:hypothetical protein
VYLISDDSDSLQSWDASVPALLRRQRLEVLPDPLKRSMGEEPARKTPVRAPGVPQVVMTDEIVVSGTLLLATTARPPQP